MTIDELIQQIDETERLIAVYRNANEVIVGTEDQIYSRRGLINRTVLTRHVGALPARISGARNLVAAPDTSARANGLSRLGR
jgi:hypothetical protein